MPQFEIVNVNTLKLTVNVNESQVVKTGTPVNVLQAFIQTNNQGKITFMLRKQIVV
jgi:hypothetical protein